MAKNQNSKLAKKIFGGILLSLIFLINGLFAIAQAATISLQALTTQVTPGQTVTVNVSLNSQDAAINNAEAVINFPPNLVQVNSVSQSGSIFSIWVQPPTYSNTDGTITFNGGLPNPGFTGNYGKILSIQFKAKAAGTAQFDFSSAAVRANDGLGTNVLNGQNGTSLTITDQTQPTPTQTPDQGPSTTFRLSSATHPDSSKWYNLDKASFSLSYPADVLASQTSLDDSAGATPHVTRKPAATYISVPNLKDGTWYFNARYQTASGWSKVYTYKIQVDLTTPTGLAINPPAADLTDALPTITAQDTLSGMSYYLVSADGAEPVKILYAGQQTPLNLPGINSGNHQINIKAYDLAGNVASLQTSLDIKAQAAVSITEYSKTITEGQRIQVLGLAPVNTIVSIELKDPDHVSRTYTTTSDDQGHYRFQSEPIAGSGDYQIRAVLFNKDGSLKSASKVLPITVGMSVSSKLAYLVSYVSVLFTPYNLIILLLSILCVIGWANYFALRHEIKIHECETKNSKKQK